MKLRITIVLLSAIIAVLCLCSFSVTEDFFVYEIHDESEITIISYSGEKYDTYVEIPSEIEGIPVTEISESAFNNCIYIETVIIPESVIAIGESAFTSCTSIKSVVFSDGDKKINIGNNAFQGCNMLQSIKFSDRPTEIGDFAFKGCYRLSEVLIPSSVTHIGYNAFDGCEQLIMDVSQSELAAGYASEYNIPTDFTQTDNFKFIIIAASVIVILAVIFIARPIIIRIRKKNNEK